ncbi:Peptidoglycan/LPS O-acetylase OafA/YrhL, contains acyltransferase and SGNH-hydrolase domains [Succinivibrio dextrinosolvens]|uniref:acyltransferase family protein n=1 Tax=Succinivibrio dextrinosolvens TaxID=83771 RepID=UPI0008EA8D5A|nr:acyltransferase family protein [Succinivibrio dextrinosolvens]SFS85830.1 Peptidoglycan/LPS O-acetylase OafA/YrhL, contains acyltransferase and SGNH-hydrolase domains [Succinivibrio dextrinosolvens]
MSQYVPSKYRPDIDGLRAIAVLSVVIYHASKHFLRGGFVGVDIFFVISGYLITGILLKNFGYVGNPSVNGNSFSSLRALVSFYARRVRRIFPVLIVVLITCLVFGHFFLFADEFELLGKHVAAGSVYISNLVLWQEAGYFDLSSDLKPLLHLWSLGIEEQFYIFWPFLILFCAKFKKNVATYILIFTVISFGFNLAFVSSNPVATFYSPLTRFWELAVGGFIVTVQHQGTSYWKNIGIRIGGLINRTGLSFTKESSELQTCLNLFSILGFITIIFSIFVINTEKLFPGAWALLPTLGASMVIIAGPDAFINRKLLSLKFFVFLGLISYPLYLWHWPLLSFGKILYGVNPPQLVRYTLILLAIFLAWVTYRFVEPPLRWGKHSRIKAVALLICLLGIGGTGLYIQKNEGFPHISEAEQAHVNEMKELEKTVANYQNNCKSKLFEHWKDPEWSDQLCAIQGSEETVDVAVIGDSHAAHLYPGMVATLQKDNPKKHNLAVFPASCEIPFIDLTSGPAAGKKGKRSMTHLLHREAYKYILDNKNIHTVVLGHTPVCSYHKLVDNRDLKEDNKDVILRNGAIRTFDMLKKHNKKVVLVLDSPLFPFTPNSCVERPIEFKFIKKHCSVKRDKMGDMEARNWFNSIVLDVAKNYDNIYIFDSLDSLCDGEDCPMVIDGKNISLDSAHLNNEGSVILGKDLMKFIDSI